MAGIVKVYGLGSKGVNLVKSPLHLDDNELVQGQNAEFYREQGIAGLRKRGGLVPHLTGGVLSGQVNGGIGLPLPPPGDNGTNPIYVAKNAGAISRSTAFTWTETSYASIGANIINDLVYIARLGRWIAVGGGGTVLTSDDNGVTWIARTAAAANNWRALGDSGALIVAVSSDGTNRVMTTTDGTTWTSASAAEANQWQAVCWSQALALWVAVASTGTHRVMTSPDGTTWTVRTAAAAKAWSGVCWSPDLTLFASLAGDTATTNVIQTSPDGITWTSQTTALNLQLSGHASGSSVIAWSSDAGAFAFPSLTGTTRSITSSTNGTTWTERVIPDNTQANGGVTAVSGGLLAMRQGATNRVDTSPDGTTWTGVDPTIYRLWDAVAWGINATTGTVLAAENGGAYKILIGRCTVANAIWVDSTDSGTSWGTTTALTRRLDASAFASKTFQSGLAVYLGYTPGQLLAWNGEQEYVLCTLPSASGGPVVGAKLLATLGDLVYVATHDGTTQRVFQLDATDGGIIQVGADFTVTTSYALTGCFYMGRLWVCATTITGDLTKASHVYSVRPGAETSWTTETTSIGTGAGSEQYQFLDLGAFNGALYVGASAGAGVASYVAKRSATGTWSTALTGPDTNAADRSQFVCFRALPASATQNVYPSGVLIVGYYDARSGVDQTGRFYATPDGTFWNNEYDYLSNGGVGTVRSAWVVGSTLYAVAKHRVFRRSPTAWSVSDSDSALVHGLLLSL